MSDLIWCWFVVAAATAVILSPFAIWGIVSFPK